MAKTEVDAGRNSMKGGPGVSTPVALGQSTPSNNSWLGINSTVGEGTTGSRPDMSNRYGGDAIDGTFFKGTSVNVDKNTATQLNAGVGGEMLSWNASGQYGPGSPNYLAGGFGAREQMTIGGDKNEGKLVGDGVNATADTNVNQYFISGKMQVQMPDNQYLAGSDEARGTNAYGSGHGTYGKNESGGKGNNEIRAKKGIGPKYPRNDARNQYE